MSEQFDKKRLIKSLKAQRFMLEVTLEPLPPDQMVIPGVEGEWSIKDILAHISVWDIRGRGWLEQAAAERTPDIPLPGKTWRDLDALNAETYAASRNRLLEEVLKEFEACFPPLLAVVEAMPPEAFARRFTYFDGEMNQTIAVARLVQWRYSHYRHHGDHIRAWLNQSV